MADDPNLRQKDRWFVPSRPPLYTEFKSMLQQEFTWRTEDEIAQAILSCRRVLLPSEGHERLRQFVRKRLRAR